MYRKSFGDMSLEEQDDFWADRTFPDSKCPVCGSYYEDVGTEQFRGNFRMVICGNCGYTFDVEL